MKFIIFVVVLMLTQLAHSETGYQHLHRIFSDMGLCSACADNTIQHYTKLPQGACGKLAKEAMTGDKKAMRSLAEFPEYCKWDYQTNPTGQNRTEIGNEFGALKHKWFSTKNGEPVTYMFSSALCLQMKGSPRFLGVASVGKQTFEFCWEDTGTFVLACRRNDYQVVTDDCEVIPRVQLVGPTAKRKSPQERQMEAQEKQREREDWLREAERARETERREKKLAADARMRAHMDRLMNANRNQENK